MSDQPDTRAVLMDLIEKAKRVEAVASGQWTVDYDIRPDGADQVMYQDADGRWLTMCFMATSGEDHDSADSEFIACACPSALLPLLALALKGLDAEESYLDCPCCGEVAAEGEVFDGQPLKCGCRGQISVDTESEPWVSVDECDCGDKP